MTWLLIALLSRLLFAGVNISGSHFRGYFSTGYAQQFYTYLHMLVLLPVLFLVVQPIWPPAGAWPWLALSGFFTAAYFLPYYQALRIADASVVATSFFFGRIFTPFIAYILIGEQLSLQECVGVAVALLGELLASYTPEIKGKFNLKALRLMILAGLGAALSGVMGKMAFNHNISGLDGFPYIWLFCTITVMSFALIPKWRPAIMEGIRKTSPVRRSYFLLPVLAIVANLGLFLSFSMTKVGFVTLTGQAQPFLVLLLMAFLHKNNKIKTLENMERKAVLRKTAAFLLMGLGITIALWNQL